MYVGCWLSSFAFNALLVKLCDLTFYVSVGRWGGVVGFVMCIVVFHYVEYDISAVLALFSVLGKARK